MGRLGHQGQLLVGLMLLGGCARSVISPGPQPGPQDVGRNHDGAGQNVDAPQPGPQDVGRNHDGAEKNVDAPRAGPHGTERDQGDVAQRGYASQPGRLDADRSRDGAAPSVDGPQAAPRDVGQGYDAAPSVAAPQPPPSGGLPGKVAPRAAKSARETEEAGAPPPPPGAPRTAMAPPAATLKAGRHDDNKEYSRFLTFLQQNRADGVLPLDVSERLEIRTLDTHGKSLANCQVEVRDLGGKVLSTTVTYADGQTQFFPAALSRPGDKDYMVASHCGTEQHTVQLPRSGRRQVEVRFSKARDVPARVPLDVAIILDTTGSMQSQIDRLKQTLEAIHFQLSQLPSQPDVRFGLVAYRDRGDAYLNQVTPFTADVQKFQQVLNHLEADGGGDTPEDLQSALHETLHTLRWRDDAVRLGFIVADAPPHTDYGQAYDYRAAMQEALTRGIKITGVGVGGLGVDAEVVLRQIAQYTLGEYVFVTEGDAGDSAGSATEASHHVGSNYHAENLDQAIVRIVRRELSYLGEDPRDFDDTIRLEGGGVRKEILSEAMTDAIRQLCDYSALPLAPHTPTAVLPVNAADKHAKGAALRLGDALMLAASRNPNLRLLERDLHAIAAELNVQLSELSDETAMPMGKLMGAQLLVVSKVTGSGDKAELFAKLVRVETGEILSVAKVALGAGVL